MENGIAFSNMERILTGFLWTESILIEEILIYNSDDVLHTDSYEIRFKDCKTMKRNFISLLKKMEEFRALASGSNI